MKLDFINSDFLLGAPQAKALFHRYAEDAPVVDFHNHLVVSDIVEDRNFGDIGELWVCQDKYKHRAMRMAGIDERFISGDAPSFEKFSAWCALLPKMVGNPLFHWSCLEMKRVFGVDDLPCAGNAEQIWNHCNGLLSGIGWSTNSILHRFNVSRLSTSDDWTDDISLHVRASKVSGINVSPSLRADAAVSFGTPSFMKFLEHLSGGGVDGIEDYCSVLRSCLDRFAGSGCVLADHALDNGFSFIETGRDRASGLFGRMLEGEELSCGELVELRSFVLVFLAGEYAERGWTMQLHIGAERWTSSRLRQAAGPAGGYACPGNAVNLRSLCDFLDALDRDAMLPKTVLYTLNPADNAVLATLTGSFGLDRVQKLQFGPAWWYNDHRHGIEENLAALSSYSILANSIGMTTDSRTILSFSRHEYFRRVLCNYLGKMMKNGELPDDIEFVGRTVLDISYRNAEKWIYNE